MPAPEPSAAREWLRFAEEDLVAAGGGLTHRRTFQPRQVCFYAQQAVEKAIKALLIAEQIAFRFTHDGLRSRLIGLIRGRRLVGLVEPQIEQHRSNAVAFLVGHLVPVSEVLV